MFVFSFPLPSFLSTTTTMHLLPSRKTFTLATTTLFCLLWAISAFILTFHHTFTPPKYGELPALLRIKNTPPPSIPWFFTYPYEKLTYVSIAQKKGFYCDPPLQTEEQFYTITSIWFPMPQSIGIELEIHELPSQPTHDSLSKYLHFFSIDLTF